MHALLAKPIDWFVIQMARRYFKGREDRCAAWARSQPDVGEFAFEPAVVSPPPDFLLHADGTFRFTSAVRTESMQNNTAFGRLFMAGADWAKMPTAVLLHGWNAEWCYRRMFPDLAAMLKEVGVNTATLELPYHLQRRPRNGPIDDFISSHLPSMLDATRQAVADTRALCRWLETQGSAGNGLWGFSLGAWLAGLVARLEPQLRFAVLTTPIASLERAILELPFCEPVRRGLEGRTVDLGRLNLGSARPLLAPGGVLLMESRHDLFAPAETVERLWQDWGEPEIWRLAHGHISVLMSRRLMKQTVGWVADRLSSTRAQ